jgi:hypothetical protein
VITPVAGIPEANMVEFSCIIVLAPVAFYDGLLQFLGH